MRAQQEKMERGGGKEIAKRKRDQSNPTQAFILNAKTLTGL